jgi:hypothetical protein
MLKRNPSFIIIHVEDMLSIKKCDDHRKIVVKKINAELSIFQVFLNYIYYFFTFIFPNFYYKFYKVFNIIFKSKTQTFIIKNTFIFYIFDSYVLFYGKAETGIVYIKLPYEYILEFRATKNHFGFQVFGKIDHSFNYIFTNDKMTITFESTDLLDFINLIKLNMYYHILFNKMDIKAIEYYSIKQD